MNRGIFFFQFVSQGALAMHFNTIYNNLKAPVSVIQSEQVLANLPMHVSNHYGHIRYGSSYIKKELWWKVQNIYYRKQNSKNGRVMVIHALDPHQENLARLIIFMFLLLFWISGYFALIEISCHGSVLDMKQLLIL